MPNGFFKIDFQTMLGTGSGVALFSEGKIHGGDSTMWYRGAYAVDGSKFTGEVTVDQHSVIPGSESVLGPGRKTVNFMGEMDGDGNSARIHGAVPSGGVEINAVITRIA